MARIEGVDLPKNKRIEIGLTYIYGIGRKLSREILKEANIDFDKKTDDLTNEEIAAIREKVVKHSVEGELRKEVSMNIKRLMEIGSYRGSRHRKGLPCRGQRTITNARTLKNRRGAKKVVANKKKASS
ncbi:MAG: 30S ribosomal protein S13 [Bacilli bacterium]